MFWSFAWAQAQTAAATAPAAGPGWFESQGIMLIMMIGAAYFLILRPQSKRQRSHQDFLSGLKHGDEVVTSSGILGRIEGLTEQFVNLEVAQGVRIRVLRTQIATSSKAVTDSSKKEKQ